MTVLLRWLRERKLPSFLKGRPTYLQIERGTINGHSLLLVFCDAATDERLLEYEMTGSSINTLLKEYCALQLKALGVAVYSDFDLDSLKENLKEYAEIGYTYEATENDIAVRERTVDDTRPATPRRWTTHTIVPPDVVIHRQEPPRRAPRLRPERVVDEPLDGRTAGGRAFAQAYGGITHEEALQMQREWRHAVENTTRAPLHGLANDQAEPLPDTRAGDAPGRPIAADQDELEREFREDQDPI